MTGDWALCPQHPPFVEAAKSELEHSFKMDPSQSSLSYPITPITTSAESSPGSETYSDQDAYDRACRADLYARQGQQDCSFDDFITSDLWSNAEPPPGFAVKNCLAFHPVSSAAPSTPPAANMNSWPNGNPAPFDLSAPFSFNDAFTPGLPFSTMNVDNYASPSDSPHITPGTPAASDGPSRSSETFTSPSSRKDSLKRDSLPADPEPAPKRVQRKRGRPRVNPIKDDPTDINTSPKSRPSRRLPHNQVERKYREGLNLELERLRRAIPTLPQEDAGDAAAPPKPSKATILTSAIEYIECVERERDQLAEEVRRLRGMAGMAGMDMRGFGGWN
ncbi:hypothetical protein GQ43DRAFT_199161 [Delitschia confertaspora ATCC 74209]|uniref:BHLH domain-containing protein n=1 Tax=Delitschia confertaspora ATCC 74209 TaxID=1513339 RepID=A0A9P4MP46_9PLEO|nr:hypothetical protein GQ43DRAFT_199161 [Delitschia confertaspora ATCC 74209]